MFLFMEAEEGYFGENAINIMGAGRILEKDVLIQPCQEATWIKFVLFKEIFIFGFFCNDFEKIRDFIKVEFERIFS